MASWAAKRKATYLSIFLIVFIVVVGVPMFFLLYEKPTCSDGKQNQGEFGIDCGGPCVELCRDSALAPVISWQRAFPVAPGYYNVIAYIENPNLDAGVRSAPYIFRLYDQSGVPISERQGRTDIPPGAIVPVFEALLETSERTVSRSSFVFTEALAWEPVVEDAPDVRITRQEIVNDRGLPRLNAVIRNESEYRLSNFRVTAIVYDFDGNALDTSETLLESLLPESESEIVFTWRVPFQGEVAKIEIVPVLYPGINY